MKPLEGKVALITGAAGTMGFATAKFLLEDGCRVAMVDVNAGANDARARELGSGTFPIAFDISDPGKARAGHARIVAELGPVDILVNNAGILSNNKSRPPTTRSGAGCSPPISTARSTSRAP